MNKNIQFIDWLGIEEASDLNAQTAIYNRQQMQPQKQSWWQGIKNVFSGDKNKSQSTADPLQGFVNFYNYHYGDGTNSAWRDVTRAADSDVNVKTLLTNIEKFVQQNGAANTGKLANQLSIAVQQVNPHHANKPKHPDYAADALDDREIPTESPTTIGKAGWDEMRKKVAELEARIKSLEAR